MIFNKNQIYILKKTKKFVKKYMNNLNDISHDYKHIKLVVKFSSKIAKKEGIKVLMDGQGADESLAGYNNYIHWYLQELLSRNTFLKLISEKKSIQKK